MSPQFKCSNMTPEMDFTDLLLASVLNFMAIPQNTVENLDKDYPNLSRYLGMHFRLYLQLYFRVKKVNGIGVKKIN